MTRVAEILQSGVRHHQAGQLQRAEALYRQVLQAEPRQADALHLLGVLAQDVNKHDFAVQYITQAIAISPKQALYHLSLAKSYQAQGDLDQAEGCCREAIRLVPTAPEPRFILANLQSARGKLAEAVVNYRDALRIKPAYPEALNNLGNTLRRVGKLQEAEASYRELLRLDPSNITALTNLGAALTDMGRLAEAETCHRDSLRLKPDYAEGHLHLGMVLEDQGRRADAEACYHTALRYRPQYPQAHFHLGNLRSSQGRLAEAEACYRESLRLQPNFPDTCFNLGNVLQDTRRHGEAEACYRNALKFRPNHAEAHHNLGNALHSQGRSVEAIACYREALRLRPNYPVALHSLGNAQRDLHDIPGARATYEEAVRMQPEHVDARNNLGACLIEEGRSPDAVVHFKEILRLQPEHAPALGNLGTLARDGFYRFTDEEVARVRTMVARPDLPLEARGPLTFALANVLDKQIKNHDEAFVYYGMANEARRQQFEQRGQGFDLAGHRRFIDGLIATGTPEFFQRFAGQGLSTDVPLFILGMPRSGTSLVEQILASHPQVYGAGELPDIPQIARDLSAAMGRPNDYPACLAQLDAATIRAAATKQLERFTKLGGTARRVTDKLPANVFHLLLIYQLFPNARVIHCLRDTIDLCISCFIQDFHTLSFATRLEDVGFYFREYERLAEHWRKVLPMQVLEVRYEDMVDNQEAMSRKVLDFCGLEWDDRCLRFHETRRVVQTSSVAQVRQPIYRSSVARWKKYERHLAPLFRALGMPAPSGVTPELMTSTVRTSTVG
jgi:tetratricopeptide (TPR) repeat protein